MDDGYYIEHMDHDFSVIHTVRPENLHFVKKISEVESIDYELSNSALDTDGNPAVFRDIDVNVDMVKPDKNYFTLYYTESDARTDIMAGKISMTNMARGRDFVRIQGTDWMGYLAQRKIPFNPLANSTDWMGQNLIGPAPVDLDHPPDGYSYSTGSRDVGHIVDDIGTFVFSKAYSDPQIQFDVGALGYTMKYYLPLADSSTLLNIIDGLSEYFPGFDYRVSIDRDFTVWTPHRFGDPDETADDGPTGDNIALAIGDEYDLPPVEIEYTNSGPQATHILGRGAGSKGSKQNTVAKALGASDIQAGYGRIDADESFGDTVKTQGVVDYRTRKEFMFQAQEVHEIEVTLDVGSVPNFWSTIRPGFAVWITEDLQMHKIQSAQHVISMDCTINNQGDGLVKLGLNQIYNTSSHYGVDQA